MKILFVKKGNHPIFQILSASNGFVTSLKTVFAPSFIGESFILPWYNRNESLVGLVLTDCQCIFSSFLNCYVIFAYKNIRPTPYITMIERKSDNVEAIVSLIFVDEFYYFQVYIDLDLSEYSNGFYKHQFFHMVADPYGYLDVARFDLDKKKIYRVPVRDILASTDRLCDLQTLGIITRFEILSPGDDPDQLDLIDEFRDRKVC